MLFNEIASTMFFRQSKDVTPSGQDVDITDPVQMYRVGIAGDVAVLLSKDQNPQVLKNVQAGEVLSIRAKKIMAAGTTAGNIIALW